MQLGERRANSVNIGYNRKTSDTFIKTWDASISDFDDRL